MSHHSAEGAANDAGHGSLEAARLFFDRRDVVREHAVRSRCAADAPAIAVVRLAAGRRRPALAVAADAGRQTVPPTAQAATTGGKALWQQLRELCLFVPFLAPARPPVPHHKRFDLGANRS